MMSKNLNISAAGSRRRGTAILYLAVCLAVMLGFVSFSVDLGRVQVVKTELRRAADAAARSAVVNLPSGSASVQAAAYNMAQANLANGLPVTINVNTDVQFIAWTSANNYTVMPSATSTGVNAVRVYCRCTAANGNPVTLLFAQVLGAKTCDVTASSIAMMNTQTTTQFTSALSDPWLAGEPTGTQGSEPDPGYFNSPRPSDHQWQYDIAGPVGGTAASGQPYESPVPLAINVTPGQVITLTNVTGLAQNDSKNSANTTATGNDGGSYKIYSDDAANPSLSQGTQTTSGSEHGISNIEAPLNSLIGVFLDNNLPDTDGTVPAGLDFSTQTAENYTSISPLVRQTFYAGNGLASGGVQQQIVVPPGATRMFLGTMDGHEWSNNVGGFTVTVTQSEVEIVQ